MSKEYALEVEKMDKEFPEQDSLSHKEAPGSKDSIIGFFCGIVSIILTFSAVLPTYLAYTENFKNNDGVLVYTGSQPMPVTALVFAVLTVVIAVVGLVFSVNGGAENAKAGFPRGKFAIAGLVLSVAGLVVSCVGFACVGCTAIVQNGAQKMIG